MSMRKIEGIKEQLMANVPDYDYFYTLQEFDDSSRAIAERFPEVVSISSIGTSREGRDILCLKIGDGPNNALLMGCPHPNEPIGSMMLEYLVQQLAENEEVRIAFPYTFHIIKVWDVDGYVRNEGWLKGPYTITNYTRHMYRPAGYEQVDWTFPIEYKKYRFDKSIPETLAVKKLIDEIKPQFIYSLHNSGFGGVYWYMTEEMPEVYSALHEIPGKNGLPLSLGEAESEASTVFDKAMFQSLGLRNNYDYNERFQGESYEPKFTCGDNSAGYALNHYGSFTFLTELPYFYDSRVEDETPLDLIRKDCIVKSREVTRKMTDELLEILADSKPYLGDNPFARTVANFNRAASDSQVNDSALDTPEYQRKVTVAESLDINYVSRFYKLTSYGMLVQAHEYAIRNLEKESGNETALEVLKRNLRRAEEAFGRIAAYLEENLNYRVVPIKNMISVQLESGLIVMNELTK